MQRILVYGVDVSDPENPKYRAMQVDRHGRLVIDPEDLDTRYLRLDGLYPMTGDITMSAGTHVDLADKTSYLKFQDALFRQHPTDATYVELRKSDLSALLNLAVDVLNAGSYRCGWATMDVSNRLRFRTWFGGAWTEVGQIYFTTGDFTISRAGDIIPVSTKTKSLGSITKYWNQAFIDEVLLTSDIDLEPSALPRIYFDHDGVSAEDSIEYDKTNNRLLFYIGGSVVGYVDNTGFHDGAP
jgi:hypothetical protein